ncbi:MAG: RDD family protein [Fibromonadaceae bacterium]|jgi:uncharacterized RDD family membrane protein YckC|nr:RDD family protein [Fibromonadaceae bacterium]
MDWYYIDSSKPEGKRRNGPWSLRQMLGFAEQGAFVPDTLVWRDGFEGWKPWGTVEPELKTEAQVEIVKQVIEEKILPNISISKNYASFWARLGAFIIDSVILQFIFVLLTPLHSYFGVLSAAEITPQTGPAELMPTVLFLSALVFIYHSFFVKNFSGTLGKIALGLAVVRHDGKPMTWSCAFLRSFVACFLSSFFALGFLLAAFDMEKRTLHDFVANTRVLKLQKA